MNERRAQRARPRGGDTGDIERCGQWVRVEVRYSDLDAQGHVNNAVFFTYFEQARVAFLAETRVRGLEYLKEERIDASFSAPSLTPGGDRAASSGALNERWQLALAGAAEMGSASQIEVSDIPYVIANASCVYSKPIASLAPIAIGVYCSEVSRASFEVRYVVCDERRQTIFATGTTLIANVDPATGRPRMLPEWMRRALAG